MNVPAKCTGAFVQTEIEGEVVLMALESGRFFTLRDTAARIWRLIDGARDRDAIEAALRAEHTGPVEAIRHDLDAFLADLRGAGFLV